MAEAEKLEAVDWTKLPTLKGSKLDDLISDYKEASAAVKDAEARKDAVRTLLAEAMVETKIPALVEGYRVAWVPPSTVPKLDKAALVKAGVTPDQLKKGTVDSSKKGYLGIWAIKEEA